MVEPRHLIDTDALSLYIRRDEVATRIINSLNIAAVSATVITADEIVSGWQDIIRRAKSDAQVADAYRRYTDSLNGLRLVTWFPFTEGAIAIYKSLRKQNLNVGNNDLRIAAIALENGATVVTRNVRDFRRVPELSVARWSDADPDGQEEL